MSQSHLSTLGTVAFDLPVMRELINFEPRSGVLYPAPWMRIVPEDHREAAKTALSKVSHEFLGRPATAAALDEFTAHLQRECLDWIEFFRQADVNRREKEREQAREAALIQYEPEMLGDIGEVVDRIHSMIEGGRGDPFAVDLLRKCIRFHGGKVAG